MGFCVPVKKTNALCSWIAFISFIQMDKTVKDITGTLGEKWQLSLNKRAQNTSVFYLKSSLQPRQTFQVWFLFSNPRTPVWKRRKLRSSQQLPLYRDSRDTEECSEHPSSCHWQSCKIYLKCLLSIYTSKTHFHFTFWYK